MSWKLLKLPPRRSKKSEITYLSSCRVCKPALNSTISAVPLCSHCSYSPHDRTIDQLTIFSHAELLRQMSKQAEQREREGAIMVITPLLQKIFTTSTHTVCLIGQYYMFAYCYFQTRILICLTAHSTAFRPHGDWPATSRPRTSRN